VVDGGGYAATNNSTSHLTAQTAARFPDRTEVLRTDTLLAAAVNRQVSADQYIIPAVCYLLHSNDR